MFHVVSVGHSEQEKVRGQNERDLLYAQKENDINIARKQAEQQQAEIENLMSLEAAKTRTEAVRLEAAANAELLTPEYLEMKKYEAIAANSKLIFGDIPRNVFLNGDGSIARTGAVLKPEETSP